MGYHAPLHLLHFGLGRLPSWKFFVVFTLFMLLHVGNGVTGSAAKSCLPSQRLALLQFKQSLSHESQALLSTWQNGSNCCKWEGVSCDHATGFVTGLDIYYLGAQVSELDPSLFELRHLRQLDLGGNSFSGVIPSELSKLTELTYLGLSNCSFSGPIPGFFQQLPNLNLLDLSFNGLSGQIPPTLFNHPTLESLQLHYNKLNGSIPDLGNQFSMLKVVDLSFNMLHGEIPSSISNMPHLKVLGLGHNNFTGIIHLSLFQNLQNLFYLDLSENNLTVEFPKVVNLDHQHVILPSVQCLFLSSCNINGEFPLALQSAKRLEVLDLSHNYIHGKMPSWVWGLPYLQRLYLSYNMIHGFNEVVSLNGSASLGLNWSLVNKFSSKRPFMKIPLMKLAMSENNIGGEIPLTLFCNMMELEKLDLSGNNLTGTIPYCFTNLARLDWLDLSDNQMHGPIPKELICGDNSLKVIKLKGNQLTGEIAKFLHNCSNDLRVLDLSQNRLMGSLPHNWLTTYYQLEMLDLSNNQLHGPILGELNNSYATRLRMLNLNNNKLVGMIPRFLYNCSNLKVIDLGSNELNDVFPFWLGHLNQLEVLMLYSNKLHGSITSPIFEHVFSSLQILDISGNQLTGCLDPRFFKSFSSMMRRQSKDELQYMLYNREFEHMGLIIKGNSILGKSMPNLYVDEQLLLNIKGRTQAQRIITMLISINLSNNSFFGKIPEEIGALQGLYSLNLSYNNLDGPIPRSLGYLKGIESLDLSHNHLSGSIPEELTKDTFLSMLDLSHNDLQGRIPQDNQFGTFSDTSFNGNPGLCGPPLMRSCPSSNTSPQDSVNGIKQETQDPHWECLICRGWLWDTFVNNLIANLIH